MNNPNYGFQSSGEVQNTPEQEYRSRLAEELAREAEGSVGIYTSRSFSTEQKDTIAIKATEHGQDVLGRKELSSTSSGGWGDYGERQLHKRDIAGGAENSLLKVSTAGETEELRFVEQENGSVEVLYVFASNSYIDDTGRPGNALNMGFNLSKEASTQLESAVHKDPSFINDVLKSQALSTGISEKTWTMMKPQYGFQDRQKRTDKDRVLKIVKPSEEPQPIPFGGKEGVSIVEYVPVEVEPSNTNATELIDDALVSASSTVELFRAQGKSDQEIVGWLEEQAKLDFIDDDYDQDSNDFYTAQSAAYNVLRTQIIEAQHSQVQTSAAEVHRNIALEEARQSVEAVKTPAELEYDVGYEGALQQMNQQEVTYKNSGETIHSIIDRLSAEMSELNTELQELEQSNPGAVENEWHKGSVAAYMKKITELRSTL